MEVTFVTTNLHKFDEVSLILKPYPVSLVHLNRSYDENHDLGIEEIARRGARSLATELDRPVIVEDTGLFFEAYPGFPGALPKFVITTIGFKGILKLLQGEDRSAYFKTVAAFAMPGTETVLFEGLMKGRISEEVRGESDDVMPYDRIFIPEGYDKVIAELSLEEKNSFSHRGEAFRKFGEYIQHNFS